jgi:UDP-N-acetylglucosamine 2-epimerase
VNSIRKELKVASIVGARPNFIKLSPIHKVLDKFFHHKIIHTGQHYDYELSDIFFKEFKIPKPTFNLDIGSGLPGFQIAEMIKEIEKILLQDKFEMVLVYGDTNSTFAGAFAAVKAGFKVAHIESGLRSFDRRMPEEINRILTDNLSNYLFAPTKTAIANLKNENIFGEVFNTGDLSVEIVREAKELASQSLILKKFQLASKSYILFTMHRAENTVYDESFISIIDALRMLEKEKIVFPMHPRTRKILNEKNLYEKIEGLSNVMIIDPVGYIDFIKLMYNAKKIITDSGGIQKESYLLSIPCITIRKNTEWIETVSEGWNVLVDINTEKIVEYVKEWIPITNNQKQIFGEGNTSFLIKDIIMDNIVDS